jgi:hypothetical protein
LRVIGQRLVAVGAMIGTLAFAYLLDHHLLDPARRASEDESGTVAYLWLAAASWILVAGCLLGLASLLLGRARHDHVVAGTFIAVGAIVLLAWPFFVTIGVTPDWLDWLLKLSAGRTGLVIAASAFIAVLGAAALASRGRRGTY